jgi:hypothetical protein
VLLTTDTHGTVLVLEIEVARSVQERSLETILSAG